MDVFIWEYGPTPNTVGCLALIVSSGADRMYGPRAWSSQCTRTDFAMQLLISVCCVCSDIDHDKAGYW